MQVSANWCLTSAGLELIFSGVLGGLNFLSVAGTLTYFYDALTEAHANAVAKSIFHFTDQSPIKVKSFLKTYALPVRRG